MKRFTNFSQKSANAVLCRLHLKRIQFWFVGRPYTITPKPLLFGWSRTLQALGFSVQVQQIESCAQGLGYKRREFCSEAFGIPSRLKLHCMAIVPPGCKQKESKEEMLENKKPSTEEILNNGLNIWKNVELGLELPSTYLCLHERLRPLRP